jgi:parallel beta-helix repeat protein
VMSNVISKRRSIVVACLLASVSLGFARDIIVPANAGFAEVRTAIDEARDGDTIVFEGSSYGPFQDSLAVSNKRLSFVSQSGRTSIVNAGRGPVLRVQNHSDFSCRDISFEYDSRGTSRNTDVVEIHDSFVSIDNCRFSGGVEDPIAKPPRGSGLLLSGATNGAIVESEFTNNEQNGLRIGGSSSVNIMRNIITNNGHDGILVLTAAEPLLEGNKVTANREDGIGYIESAGGLARDNIVDGNADDGFDISDYAAPTIENNTVYLNGDDGFEVSVFATPTLRGNMVRDNGDVAFSYEYLAGGFIEFNQCENNNGERFRGAGGDVILVPMIMDTIHIDANDGCSISPY